MVPTVTSETYQPLSPSVPDGHGEVRRRATQVEVDAALGVRVGVARGVVHVPVADWSAPSVLSTWLTVGSTTPTMSVHDQVTVTSELFQPPAFGVGDVLT